MDTAFLKHLGSGQKAQTYPLSLSAEMLIGRDPSCQIVLDYAKYDMVSRRHTCIRPIDRNSFEICDLGSANGTYVNGQRLQGCQRLLSGDRFKLGNNGPEFIFEQPSLQATVVSNNQVLPTVINSNQPNYYTNQAPPPNFVGSNQANSYPNPVANSNNRFVRVLGIIALVVIGGSVLGDLSSRKASVTSPTATPSTGVPGATPSSTSSPQGTTPTSPTATPSTESLPGGTPSNTSSPQGTTPEPTAEKQQEFLDTLKQHLDSNDLKIYEAYDRTGHTPELKTALVVCRALDNGNSLYSVLTAVVNSLKRDYTGEELKIYETYYGKVVGTGILVFCPQHAEQLKNSANSNTSNSTNLLGGKDYINSVERKSK